MNLNCGYQGCSKKANRRCTCTEQYLLCKYHIEKHSKFIGCSYISLEPIILLAIAKSKENANAFKRLDLGSICLARKND